MGYGRAGTLAPTVVRFAAEAGKRERGRRRAAGTSMPNAIAWMPCTQPFHSVLPGRMMPHRVIMLTQSPAIASGREFHRSGPGRP